MALMEGRNNASQARFACKNSSLSKPFCCTLRLNWPPCQPGQKIMLRNEFQKNTDPDMDFYNERDGVNNYVSLMLDDEDSWGTAAHHQLRVLQLIIHVMARNSRLARETYALMGARLEADVEHKLKAWIYFHERIVQVLRREIPHRTPRNDKRLARLPDAMLTCLSFQRMPDRWLGAWPQTAPPHSTRSMSQGDCRALWIYHEFLGQRVRDSDSGTVLCQN